jgi:hypothetical protein
MVDVQRFIRAILKRNCNVYRLLATSPKASGRILTGVACVPPNGLAEEFAADTQMISPNLTKKLSN